MRHDKKTRRGWLRRFRRGDLGVSENRKPFDPTMQSITYDGVTMSGQEWAREAGLPYTTFKKRFQNGWPMEKCLDTRRRSFGGRKKEAAQNTRYTINGVTRMVPEWSRVSGIPTYVLYARLRKGYTMKQALSLPYEPDKREPRLVEYEGKRLTLAEWSKETGIPMDTLIHRYRSGLSPGEILSLSGNGGSAVIEYNGRKQSIAKWALELGIPVKVLRKRYKDNLPPEKILDRTGFDDLKDTLLIEYEGRKMDLSQWSMETGISKDDLFRRYLLGWRTERMLSPEKKFASAETILLDYNGYTKSISEWALETGIPEKELLERYRRGFPPSMILSKSGNMLATANRRHMVFARFRRCR